MITIGFAMGFFGMPYVQILPAFAKDVLGAGAGEAGLLITGAGVGSLVGTVILASLGDSPHKNRVLLISIFGFGVSLLVFAWTQWFWATWLTLLFVGMGTSMIPMITTILQLTVPTEFQGRVLSLWYLSAGLMFVGALPMAMVADAVSWPIAITGGAVFYLLIAFWLGLWRPTLRRLKV
jgi:MFS family permease